KLLAEAGLEPLKYEFSGFVRAVFYRTSATEQVTQETTQETTQEKILAMMRERPSITRDELAQMLELSSDIWTS
ncbi:MAG: hypothetical protein WCK85_12945, partial [Chlorobium sp.]